MTVNEAKNVLLQLARDINDGKVTIKSDILSDWYIWKQKKEIMMAIERLCVPTWLRVVRNECRKRGIL